MLNRLSPPHVKPSFHIGRNWPFTPAVLVSHDVFSDRSPSLYVYEAISSISGPQKNDIGMGQ